MRVVIVEDQALLRTGLVRLFEDSGHEVVGSYADATGLLQAVLGSLPDLVVADIRMPPTFTDEGVRAAQAIKAQLPDMGVLLLSQHVDTSQAVNLVPLGGFGYLLKDRVLDVAEFVAAAERVAAGGSALDPQVVASLVQTRREDSPLDPITERERGVLALMAEGLTNTAIARRLVLSERTVETHVRHVLMKLQLPEGEDGHRRVLAVLTYLAATAG
ncbi:MAG: putative two-component system response regulator [Frankiales bacterium]|jgi:DNA-binding NarL/FixJ family response regulator|nr:putative two-component system response regulator [Frankiales bacterium]